MNSKRLIKIPNNQKKLGGGNILKMLILLLEAGVLALIPDFIDENE